MSCEAPLTAMMSVDLVAMLEHVRVDMPPDILAMTAQLWEPYAACDCQGSWSGGKWTPDSLGHPECNPRECKVHQSPPRVRR